MKRLSGKVLAIRLMACPEPQPMSAAAIEWAGFGVQVNALAPGYVETDMNAAARSDEEMKAKILRQIPARRMARPEELGPLVVYLASSASDFMTGETLVFDGGQVAK